MTLGAAGAVDFGRMSITINFEQVKSVDVSRTDEVRNFPYRNLKRGVSFLRSSS